MRECKLIKFTCLTKRRMRLAFPVSVSTLIDKPFSTWHKTLEQTLSCFCPIRYLFSCSRKLARFNDAKKICIEKETNRNDPVFRLVPERHAPGLQDLQNFLLDFVRAGVLHQLAQLLHEGLGAHLVVNQLAAVLDARLHQLKRE